MDLSCPPPLSEVTAQSVFSEGSFLQEEPAYDEMGNLTKASFQIALDKARSGKIQNVFSMSELISKIHREYCFISQQYLVLLRDYIRRPSQEARARVQAKNREMQNLLSCQEFIAQASNNNMAMVNPSPEQRPFSYLAETFTDLQVELREQMANLSDSDLLQLRKDQEEYSKQKNASATNLLGIYAFLNLTAIGILIYIFRSK
jgi:hypothetical protein